MMILDLHRQGVNIAAIARQVGVDRKTVRKYIARGVEVPTYGPRQPRERLLDPHIEYLRARLDAYPGLSAQLLERKPAKIATVALANKTARIAWAVMSRKEVYAAACVTVVRAAVLRTGAGWRRSR